MDQYDESPQSSQPLAGGAQSLYWGTFPSSDSDCLYAVGDSQQTSDSQTEEEAQWLGEGDLVAFEEPLGNKKCEAYYSVVENIPKLQVALQQLVNKSGVMYGWCNLVQLATNKGESAADPFPETRKGYVQISLNNFNKVRVSSWGWG